MLILDLTTLESRTSQNLLFVVRSILYHNPFYRIYFDAATFSHAMRMSKSKLPYQLAMSSICSDYEVIGVALLQYSD